MLRDSYIFWIFFRQGVTVPSFIIVGYMWQILERGPFWPPIREQPQKGPSWIGLRANLLQRIIMLTWGYQVYLQFWNSLLLLPLDFYVKTHYVKTWTSSLLKEQTLCKMVGIVSLDKLSRVIKSSSSK